MRKDTWMGSEAWVGRKIVSTYGVVCEVLSASQAGQYSQIAVRCSALHNNRLWDWYTDQVSLVTKGGEILDVDSGEVFGKIVNDDWVLYPDDQCRKLSPEELEKEFRKDDNEMVRRTPAEQGDCPAG